MEVTLSMKIGLVSARSINRDIAFNTAQIIKYLRKAKENNLEYIFFGESFLQGFYSLSFEYVIDKEIAINKTHEVIKDIIIKASEIGVGVGFGYMELEDESIYSSYMVVSPKGDIKTNFRRVSKGWKKFRETDHHYKEGNEVNQILIDGKLFTIALCGDLWDEDTVNMFIDEDVRQSTIIWPVHVDFTLEEWKTEINEYHTKALSYAPRTLFINNIMTPNTHGGAFVFEVESMKGHDFGKEGFLIVEV